MTTLELLSTVVAALLVWQVLLLIPMVPGKFIDTRDFSKLPLWQFNGFNIFLTTLGIVSCIVAVCAIIAQTWIFGAALVLGVLYLTVFASDLFGVFPAVKDPPPMQLLILETISFASAGILIVIAVQGLRLA